MPPQLSIIIPFHNAEATIARTIRSLVALDDASRERVQVVLVDDGSDDESAAIAREEMSKVVGLPMETVSQSNQGLAAARNAGLDWSDGRWVLLLDADDELLIDPVPLLDEDRWTAVLFDVQFVRDGRVVRRMAAPKLGDGDPLPRLTRGNPLTVSSIVFRRDCIAAQFDRSLRALEDWRFWFDNPGIFERTTIADGLPLASIHLHNTNMSADQPRMGEARQRVAEQILASREEGLNATARNNLLLQAQIGRVQQGGDVSIRNLVRFPCSPEVYVKLWVYWLRRLRQ